MNEPLETKNSTPEKTAKIDDSKASEAAKRFDVTDATVPDVVSVRHYMMYGLSFPERALRSTAAMVGGVLTESAALLVPQAFRDSKSYQTFVQQMLDLVANDVGGVTNKNLGEDSAVVEDYVARKTVGSFIDLAGLATLHVSPVVVLAVVADVAYGSKTYLNELADQLKKEGVIAEDSTINGATDFLNAISDFSGKTASAFDTPPINIEGLRKTINETSENLSQIDPTTLIPKSEIDQLWSSMNTIAEKENVGLFEVSSALTMYTLNQVETVTKGALTTIMVTGNLFDQHILQHYWDGLEKISNHGIYSMVAESSQPYIEAVWYNFSIERETITADLVSGKMVGKIWNGLRDWMKPKDTNIEDE